LTPRRDTGSCGIGWMMWVWRVMVIFAYLIHRGPACRYAPKGC
jgi:hypothetical protein